MKGSGGDSEINVPIYKTVEEFEKNLPETIEILSTKEKDRVYLVGTAHFSKLSQDDVSLVMRNIKPHGVMLELCPLRLHILKYDEETLLKEAGNMNPTRAKQIISEHGISAGMFYLSFLKVSADITKQLGVAPGGECRRAVAEARKLPNCKVLLGDRPINITLKRAMTGLTWKQRLQMSMYMGSIGGPAPKLTAADIEKYKKRDAASLDNLKDNLPTVYKAFVTERDIILAHSLTLGIQALKAAHKDIPINLVGVIGMGHMNGVLENFGHTTDDQVKELLTIPKKTWFSSKYIPPILAISGSVLTKLLINTVKIAR